MEYSRPIRPEDLLEHLTWAKALARRLVSDDATADDVVQESMVAALQHPPQADRPVRPWLSRVLDNTARQRARGEGRRAARERAAAHAEALPSASELTSRAEAQRLLIDALLTLDEASREVVLLRYFEDLSSAEIARRTGQPAGTVRSRLKRALDDLREKLDDRFEGERGGWHAVLAPLTLPRVAAPATAAAGVFVLGGLLMKGAVAIGLLAAITLVVAFLGNALPSFRPVPVEGVTFVPIAADDTVATAEPSAAATVTRSAIDRAEPTASETPPSVVGDGQVTLRFVDEFGQPLAGVEASSRRQVTAISGADGNVTVTVWYGGELSEGRIRVQRAGLASDSIPAPGAPGTLTDLGDVELHLGGALSGTVVNGHGTPLEGIRVFVQGRERRVSTAGGMQMVQTTDLGAAETRSDADGRFRLTGVYVGDVRVDAVSDDRLHKGRSGRVEIRAGQESAGLVVVAEEIDPDTRIEGVVLGPDGEPEPFASVNARWRSFFSSGSSSRTTDEDGRFRLIVPARMKTEMDFRQRRSGTATAHLDKVRGGTLDLQVQLVEPARFIVSLTNADGTPTMAARIHARTDLDVEGGDMTSEDGLFELRALNVPFRVHAFVDGHAEATSALLDPAALPAIVRLELRALPRLRGVVVSNGRTVQDVDITVRALATETTRVAELPSLVDPSPVARARTDAEGRFSMMLRKSGQYVLRAEIAGFAPAEFGPFEHDPEAERNEIEIDLTGGGVLEGVVLDGDAVRQSHVVLVSRGDGLVQTERTDPDGAYRFDHLMPGPWMVRIVPELIDPSGSSSTGSWGKPFRDFDADCFVREGETTRFDPLVGRLEARVAVRGQVTFAGFDAARMGVDLLPLAGNRSSWSSPESNRVDADGAFTIQGGAPGPHMLLLFDATEEEESDALRFAVQLELTAGENAFALDVSFGEVSVGDAADGALERLLWRGPNGVFAIAPLPAVGASRPFPAGAVQRVPFATIALGDLNAAEVLEEVRLEPGAAVVLGQ